MLRHCLSTLALLAVLGLARAQVIDTVAPAVGAPGQVITIDGSGLLGTGGVAKPVVFLRDPVTLKKNALQVTEFSATQIKVVFNKGLAGARDLVVKPKGEAEVVSAAAFEVKAPVFTAVDSGTLPADHAEPGAQVTVNGQFLGTIPGSLFLGSKKAQVVSWADDAIVFTVPAKVGSGFYSIKIKDRVASTVVSFAIVISNGLALPHKPDALSTLVDKKKFVPAVIPIFGLELITTFVASPDPPAPDVPTVSIVATRPSGSFESESKTVNLNIPFDPGVDSAQPLVAGEPNGSLSYSQGSLFETTTWDTTANDNYAIIVLSFTDNQFVGQFSGTLDRTTGTGGNPVVVIKKGKFRGTLTQ